MRVMFYNLENMYNPSEDSSKNDEEYQPTGSRKWTYFRLKRKQINIAKVILSVGGWDPPELVGVCEVEDFSVLYGLINDTPLKSFGYKIILYPSPDPRGINVGLLYRPDKFKPINKYPIPIRYPFDTSARTRDILYVQGIACDRDTVDVYINHWPSKLADDKNSIAKRDYVASVLRRHIDSLMVLHPETRCLIMGDLNSTPDEGCVHEVLVALTDSAKVAPNGLYDMLGCAGVAWNKGTIKFHERWEAIDHIIVSGTLLSHTTPHSMHIFDAPFLLQDDEVWFGKKPFRTYNGPKYLGGFSDHLPVYADFKF